MYPLLFLSLIAFGITLYAYIILFQPNVPNTCDLKSGYNLYAHCFFLSL